MYASISLLSFLILLSQAPFVHKVHRLLNIVAALFIFVLCLPRTVCLARTPLHLQRAYHSVLAQKVDFSRPQVTYAITQLDVEGYGRSLTATFPSSWSSFNDSDEGKCIVDHRFQEH